MTPYEKFKDDHSDTDSLDLEQSSVAPPPPEKPREEDWVVCFHPGKPSRQNPPGQVIPIGRQFAWGDTLWHVPAIYACSGGLVIDLFAQVDADRVWAFIRKWDLLHEEDHNFTEEEQEQIEAEHPMSTRFSAQVTLNGRSLRHKGGSGFGWIPGVFSDKSAKRTLEHYGLSLEHAWTCHRLRFYWATIRKPVLKSLILTLSQDPVPLPAGHFTLTGPGQRHAFCHPVTGQAYTLTVLDCSQQTLKLGEKQADRPNQYLGMEYTLTPPLPREAFTLRDCTPDDPSPNRDGPIGVIFAVPKGDVRAACSSFRFHPVEQVEWRMTFHEKTREDVTAALL